MLISIMTVWRCMKLATWLAKRAARASAVPLYATSFSAGAQRWNSCSQLAIKEDGTTIMKGPETLHASTKCAMRAITCDRQVIPADLGAVTTLASQLSCVGHSFNVAHWPGLHGWFSNSEIYLIYSMSMYNDVQCISQLA